MKRRTKYTYQGVTYTKHVYMYRDYMLEYEVYHDHKRCHACIEGEDEQILFSSSTRSEVVSRMKAWFRDVVHNRHIEAYRKKGYFFDTSLSPLMKDVRSHRVAYHITRPQHHDSIMKHGLLPSHTADSDIVRASYELDQLKPSWIPQWVKKQDALYLHPEMGNDFLSFYGGPFHVYAVTLPDEKAWVGSRTIGGWCLFDEDMEDDLEWEQAHLKQVQEEYGVDYWKYSCSLQEYVNPSRRTRRKIRRGMLDELLVFQSIPSSHITWVGTFDEEGTFVETASFSSVVRKEYHASYSDILQKLRSVK